MSQSADASGEIVLIQGKKLTCAFCGHERFHHRTSLLNTRKAALFNFEWLNPRADNYICDQCGYICWFLKKKD